MKIIKTLTAAAFGLFIGGCDFKPPPPVKPPPPKLKLTSEWHREEESKIDRAVDELRLIGKWDPTWDRGQQKFERLGSYGWRTNMDCRGEVSGVRTKPDGSIPCNSGGYSFNEEAFEKLKRGDLSHNPHNTVEESFEMQRTLTNEH